MLERVMMSALLVALLAFIVAGAVVLAPRCEPRTPSVHIGGMLLGGCDEH